MRGTYKAGAAAAAPVVPVVPSVGYPTEGDPAARPVPIPPTTIGAWWFHSVTAEISAVIEAAGGVPGDTTTQLRDAIRALLPSAATTLAAGIVELATAAEAMAGDDDTRAVTPAALEAALMTITQGTILTTAPVDVRPGGTAIEITLSASLANYRWIRPYLLHTHHSIPLVDSLDRTIPVAALSERTLTRGVWSGTPSLAYRGGGGESTSKLNLTLWRRSGSPTTLVASIPSGTALTSVRIAQIVGLR